MFASQVVATTAALLLFVGIPTVDAWIPALPYAAAAAWTGWKSSNLKHLYEKLTGWGGTKESCDDEEAAKALSLLGLGMVSNIGLVEGQYKRISCGKIPDHVYYGFYKEQPVVYFQGSTTAAKWANNPSCAAGFCDYKSMAADVDGQLPDSFKSDDVVVIAFSRGNFFGAAYTHLYPHNVGAFASIASPGHMRDPTSGAWTSKVESHADPVSMLNSPEERFHYEKYLKAAIHNSGSYYKEVKVWAYGSHLTNPTRKQTDYTAEEISRKLDCKKF